MACRRQSKNQLSISKVLIVPDNKPDIERVLRVISTPEVRKTSIIKGKVVLTGDIHVSVEYVACSHCNTQPVHFASFRIPFAHFIDHKCAQPWQEAKISAAVEFQEIQLINRRTLNIFIILLAVIRKLDGANVLIKSQVCTPTLGATGSPECIDPCSDHVVDCSACQPCGCASCSIDC